jgi:hypothetical protein
MFKITGAVLIVTASLIRFEVFTIIVLLTLIPLIYGFNKERKRLYYLVGMTYFVALVLFLLDQKLIYKNEYESTKLKEIRSIVDNPNNSEIKKNQELIEVCKPSYDLFCYFVTDRSVLSDQQRSKIINALTYVSIEKRIVSFCNQLILQLNWLIPLSMLIFIKIISCNKRDKQILFGVLMLLIVMILGVHLMGLTLKKRVLISVMFVLLAIIYFRKDKSENNISGFFEVLLSLAFLGYIVALRLLGTYFIGITICFLILVTPRFVKISNIKKQLIYVFMIPFLLFNLYFVFDRFNWSRNEKHFEQERAIKEQITLMRRHQTKTNKAIFLYPSDFEVTSLSPFSISETMKNIKFICSGWAVFLKRNQDLNRSLLEAVSTSSFLVRKNNAKFKSLVIEFLRCKFKKNMRFRIVDQSSTHELVEFEHY